MEQAQPIGETLTVENPASQGKLAGQPVEESSKMGVRLERSKMGMGVSLESSKMGMGVDGMLTTPTIAPITATSSGPSICPPGSGSDIKWWLKKIYGEQKKIKKQIQSLIDQASKSENSESNENSENNSSGGGKTRRKYKKKRATRR